MPNRMFHELRHAKTGLEIFVVAIAKGGWLAPAHASLLLGLTLNIHVKYNPGKTTQYNSTVNVISRESVAEQVPTKTSFGLTLTIKSNL